MDTSLAVAARLKIRPAAMARPHLLQPIGQDLLPQRRPTPPRSLETLSFTEGRAPPRRVRSVSPMPQRTDSPQGPPWVPSWRRSNTSPFPATATVTSREAAEAEVVAHGFDEALQRAREEGLDIFAAAPELLYRATTPRLAPVHLKGTGMVQTPSSAKRLDACLTSDYFQRPDWNVSTAPSQGREDARTLETMARQLRGQVMTDCLRQAAKAGGEVPLNTTTGTAAAAATHASSPRGLPLPDPRRRPPRIGRSKSSSSGGLGNTGGSRRSIAGG